MAVSARLLVIGLGIHDDKRRRSVFGQVDGLFGLVTAIRNRAKVALQIEYGLYNGRMNHMYTVSNQPDDEHPPEYIEQVDDLYAYEEEASKLRGSYRKNEREAFKLVQPV